ncbi:hypothetical protein Nepgr_008706 [Nepenthes gracilis]|uniref:Uncharacterized protein n=1 Tax=Nepenthes gracilis TaxID=150966 RepID=A0AAD3S9I9_NEPGR|nr:hypothetical protein Nepgr_008706 [Nepenthes gracilis]
MAISEQEKKKRSSANDPRPRWDKLECITPSIFEADRFAFEYDVATIDEAVRAIHLEDGRLYWFHSAEASAQHVQIGLRA